MAGVKRSRARGSIFFSRYGLTRLTILLLLVTGAFQLPIPFDAGSKFALPHYLNKGYVAPNIFSWGEFFRFMMKPLVTPDTDLTKESKNSFEEYQNQQVSSGHTSALKDKASDDIYNNSLNEIDMDNLSKSRTSNITILDNSNLQTDKVNDGTFLMKWNNSTVPENWWSVCQVPVIVVLFGVIGILAISLIVILWLKKHILKSDKQGDANASDINDDSQLMSGNCPCPSPGIVPEEQWISHSVIDLKNPVEGATEEAVQVQPQDTTTEIMSEPTKDGEKKPEGLKLKAKGLLERRGSSASLTIDLTQNTLDTKMTLFTPTQECGSEEFLLSAANVLNRTQLKARLVDIQGLHSEFWDIPLNHPEKSEVFGSGLKNRYETILPNEKTRVKLIAISDNPLDSYINANYMRGYEGEDKAYIATQGPLGNTISDLYQMAWNDNAPAIVMITKLNEKSKSKCESYFPLNLGECIKYGDYEVTVLNIKPKDGYTIRELLVKKKEEAKLILHFWFDTWPDHKTPDEADAIVAMASEIEMLRYNLKRFMSPTYTDGHTLNYGPVIVHCSAGIGRTGCFIGICIGMNQLKKENKVDVLGIVCQMRYDRGGMIQTAEQYEYVHKALAQYADSLPKGLGD